MTLRVSADQGTTNESTDSLAYADQYTNPASNPLRVQLAPKGPSETERARRFHGGAAGYSRDVSNSDSSLESSNSGALPPGIRSGTQPEGGVESAFRLNPFGNVSDEPLPSNVIRADSTPLRGSRNAERKQIPASPNGNGTRGARR